MLALPVKGMTYVLPLCYKGPFFLEAILWKWTRFCDHRETYTPSGTFISQPFDSSPAPLWLSHSENQGPDTIKSLHPTTVTHLNSLHVSHEWPLHILSSTHPSLQALRTPTTEMVMKMLSAANMRRLYGHITDTLWVSEDVHTGLYNVKSCFSRNRKQTDVWAWTCVIHHAPWHALSGKGSRCVWGSSKEQGHLG